MYKLNGSVYLTFAGLYCTIQITAISTFVRETIFALLIFFSVILTKVFKTGSLKLFSRMFTLLQAERNLVFQKFLEYPRTSFLKACGDIS